MPSNIPGRVGPYLLPRLLPRSRAGHDDGTVPVEDVRDVATEGALASAIDASPAVLVSLWAHDERLHRSDRPRRGR